MFPDLIKVADTVANEKNISHEEIFGAIEEALKKAMRFKYGEEHDLHVEIDRKNGEYLIYRLLTVVESPEAATEISLAQARRIAPQARVGEVIVDPLPPLVGDRISAHLAKQVITQKLREAERRHQYQEYKDRVGELVRGVVKRSDKKGCMIDLGRAEAFLPREQTIPWEVFRLDDRIRAVISEVRQETNGPQIFLSRTSDMFLIRLARHEISDIAEGLIEIKAVAREPGSHSKMAVFTRDTTLDPVGACIGRKGIKIQPIVNELQKERIDVIPWSEDPVRFLANAFSPIEVTKIVFVGEKHVEVTIPDHESTKILMRKAQNLRLITKLTGFHIELFSERETSARQTAEFKQKSEIFMEALEVDDMIAHILVMERFRDIEEIANTPLEDLASIENFNLDIAEELQDRALQHLERQTLLLQEAYQALQMDDSISQITQWDYGLLIKLGENGIKTRQDLADLSFDELADLIQPEEVEEARLKEIILKAREISS